MVQVLRRRAGRPAGSREDGFSMMELLVVIVILGILAAIALPNMLGQRAKSARAAVAHDLRNAALVEKAIVTEVGRYGSALADLVAQGFQGSASVELAVVSADDARFCLMATHPLLADPWYVSSDADAQSPSDVPCT